MDAARGSAGFVFARARANRPLLAAALLTVLLTTAVLATLAAYSTTIGDAALRHALTAPRDAADTTLLVKAEALPEGGREAADTAVREGAERAFDGLPVTLRTLARSGPYGLPLSLRGGRARRGRGARPDALRGAGPDAGQDHRRARPLGAAHRPGDRGRPSRRRRP